MLLNEQELATVLAALRYWQQDLTENGVEGIIDQEHFAKEKPLTTEAIDDLCERLNADPFTPEDETKILEIAEVALDNSGFRQVLVDTFELSGPEMDALYAKLENYVKTAPTPDGRPVDLIASSYEWVCPNCGVMRHEIEITETVTCHPCKLTFSVGDFHHATKT